MTDALFDIDADGGNQGFTVVAGQTFKLKLRANPAIGVQSVRFQVWDPSASVPTGTIADNPPKASPGAPLLNLDNGTVQGQSVLATTPTSEVDMPIPGGTTHAWLVRCVVNNGVSPNPRNGIPQVDPSLIHERLISVDKGSGRRDIVATETTQDNDDGWALVFQALTNAASGGSLQDAYDAGAAIIAASTTPVSITTDANTFSALTLDTAATGGSPTLTVANGGNTLLQLGAGTGFNLDLTAAGVSGLSFSAVVNGAGSATLDASSGTGQAKLLAGSGGLVVRDASGTQTNLQVLTTDGTLASWQDAAGGSLQAAYDAGAAIVAASPTPVSITTDANTFSALNLDTAATGGAPTLTIANGGNTFLQLGAGTGFTLDLTSAGVSGVGFSATVDGAANIILDGSGGTGDVDILSGSGGLSLKVLAVEFLSAFVGGIDLGTSAVSAIGAGVEGQRTQLNATQSASGAVADAATLTVQSAIIPVSETHYFRVSIATRTAGVIDRGVFIVRASRQAATALVVENIETIEGFVGSYSLTAPITGGGSDQVTLTFTNSTGTATDNSHMIISEDQENTP